MKTILLLLIAVHAGAGTETNPRMCEQKENATRLLAFSSVSVPLKLPCKYNAVRQTCGNYEINLSPGLTLYHYQFNMDTLWMGLHRNDGKTWLGRTSNKITIKFANGRTDDLFNQKKPDPKKDYLNTSDVLNFTRDGVTGVATEKNNAFRVTITPWDPQDKNYPRSRWSFECLSPNFSPAPHPQQVCGVQSKDKLRDLDREQTFMFHVLNETDTNITQTDEKCKVAEDIFQNNCSNGSLQDEAIATCSQILTKYRRRKCVAKYTCGPMDVFVDCLQWTCSNYTNTDACERLGAAIEGCKNFNEENLAGKVEAAGCYKGFLRID